MNERVDGGFEVLARIEELPPGTLLGVEKANGDRVCLVNHAGEVSALADVCTHQAFPLSAGEVLADGTVQCAWHGARFDCRSGAVRRPPAEDSIAVYEVRVAGGEILVGPRRS